MGGGIADGGDLPFSPLTFVGGVAFREVYFALTFGMLDSRLRGNDGGGGKWRAAVIPAAEGTFFWLIWVFGGGLGYFWGIMG